ncbi:hypothetical protein PFLUV_G00117570 [Perca fluviatilis]|uniref:SEA domain-containing protein n=1 Tax=Perca fluviatilis TaxID=8168 RepID=A0A6A5F6H9_PERFL|nr:hypothetical protein PFLUV_G00117570 [Perca fluviatilis]
MAVTWIISICLILIAATTPADPATTAAPTVPATTAEPTLELARVYFRSVQSTFTNDLLNPSSTAFINRAALTKRELEPIFQRAFPCSFKSSRVRAFRSGSVITLVDLSFVSMLIPDHVQIAYALKSSASNVTGFDIEVSSINVNGIYSSGISHNISLFTASCLVLLSWLLSSQQ